MRSDAPGADYFGRFDDGLRRLETARLGAGQPKVDRLLEEIDELIDDNGGGGEQEYAVKLMLLIGATLAARERARRTRGLPV
ncbi:MAG: hypothetical protein JXR83_01350 [Deltaproteobacteria bacterium]|nr:hypothetical protein [Deltaproteobacteria bacterium]